MLQVHNNNELSAQIQEWKRQRNSIAFVPTMGNLHQGHLSLLQLAREQADKLVSSIFVNPMQFGPNEDLAQYPRTLERDCKALMEHRCDLVYLPGTQELYPQALEHITVVQVPDITDHFEGEFRPGHLTGVSTIVLKLFNLVQPDLAVFGKKDYQQWRMIEKMIHDLNLPIDIIAGETVREPDGLAMSSRNQYLTPDQRNKAVNLRLQLQQVAQEIQTGNNQFKALINKSVKALTALGIDVNYFAACHQSTLQPAMAGDPLVVIAAIKLGNTRLLDNIEIPDYPDL